MIQLTAQMSILVCSEPVDFRCGIDSLCRMTRNLLKQEPFSGSVFVFINRSKTAIKLLTYDGQGFWLCQKRLSQGHFAHWPRAISDTAARQLLAHELQVLLAAGNPFATQAASAWRPVTPSLPTVQGSV